MCRYFVCVWIHAYADDVAFYFNSDFFIGFPNVLSVVFIGSAIGRLIYSVGQDFMTENLFQVEIFNFLQQFFT